MFSSRSLIKSMLRKNPELRPNAAELLRHPHLQGCVLNIHMKLNTPRRSSFPVYWHETDYINKARFSVPGSASVSQHRARRLSSGGDRNLNPSISETDQEFSVSNKTIRNIPSCFDQGAALSVGSTHEGASVTKRVTSKTSNVSKNPKKTPVKPYLTVRRQAELSKNRELIPTSRTSVKKPVAATRRASLPLLSKAEVQGLSRRPSLGALDCIKSPDISVNAPRLDRMVEFNLDSYEDSFLPVRRTSLASIQGSNSPQGDHSLMKDKCTTVQVLDKPFDKLSCTNAWEGFPTTPVIREEASDCSDQNATAGASSRTSSDLRRRRFDMSSYQQRAEALEGLLEFSARLLQEERFDELGVLLKPFGPGKVSPRETAIWLTKSFKENTTKPEDQPSQPM